MRAFGESFSGERGIRANRLRGLSVYRNAIAVGVELNAACGRGNRQRGQDDVGATLSTARESDQGECKERKRVLIQTSCRRHRAALQDGSRQVEGGTGRSKPNIWKLQG